MLEPIDNGPGVLGSSRIGVFRVAGDREELVGEYVRGLPGLGSTFHPFRAEDQELALYSPDYTTTRLMRLPSCEDIGGEEPNSWGFCPVEYYVPSFVEREYFDIDDTPHRYRIIDPKAEDLLTRTMKVRNHYRMDGTQIELEKPDKPLGSLQFFPFGFVAGCIWGDDSSRKIQYLDLTDAARGIIRRQDKFGYIALPRSRSLRQSVHISSYEWPKPEDTIITIDIEKKYKLLTGEPVEERAPTPVDDDVE